MHVNKAEIFKFKVRDNIPWYKLCVESVSRDFAKLELSEVSLNCTVYVFSVDHSVTEKDHILNMQFWSRRRIFRLIKQSLLHYYILADH